MEGLFAWNGPSLLGPDVGKALIGSEVWWCGVRFALAMLSEWALHAGLYFIACTTRVLLQCTCCTTGGHSSVEYTPYMVLLSTTKQLWASGDVSFSHTTGGHSSVEYTPHMVLLISYGPVVMSVSAIKVGFVTIQTNICGLTSHSHFAAFGGFLSQLLRRHAGRVQGPTPGLALQQLRWCCVSRMCAIQRCRPSGACWHICGVQLMANGCRPKSAVHHAP
jgi:hypothetical protein